MISEGELRMCKKVGEEKEEVILDTRMEMKENTVSEVINEIPEVVLSEEQNRQIKFSDQIEFK